MVATARVQQLDGLRGLAALAVVFSHLVGAILPSWIPGGSPYPETVAHTPFRTLYDGALAVDIFFVLSGYVISQSASRRGTPLYLQLMGRYLRLTLPMLVSVMFSVLLLLAFPEALAGMRDVAENGWLHTFYAAPPVSDWQRILLEPSLLVYLGNKPLLNPVLWTMRYEFWGSCGLYILYAATSGRPRQFCLLVLAMALAVTGRTQYLDFVLGAALFELGAQIDRSRFTRYGLAGPMILVGLLGAGPYLAHPQIDPFRYSFSATCIVIGVLKSSYAATVLNAPWARHLGYISFPLYLLHFPLLFTIFATVLPYCHTILSTSVTVAIYLLVSLSSANIFARWIDDPLVRAIRGLQRRFANRSPTTPAAL